MKGFFYITTIFLSSFLLFQIQPMIAKIILPWFGGTAAVWITCMLFFQSVLVSGYAYAHWSVNHLGLKHQEALHCVLTGLSLLFLPVSPASAWKPVGTENPAFQILGLLSVTAGLPYFLLSATSPLLQAWFSRAYDKTLPYRLFALSNAASLLGLVVYPFLIEPGFTLRQQSLGWSAGYLFFAIACMAAAWKTLTLGKAADTQQVKKSPVKTASPALSEKIVWLLLAACPSVLFLAVTNYLTQNVAAIPFLWVLPLSLYLFSFALCFERDGWYRRNLYVWLLVTVLAGISYGFVEWGQTANIKIVVPLFSLGLFVCCMFCHGELALRRPAPIHLTSFYLMISIGGALGGLFVGLIAPSFFTCYLELPVGLVLCGSLLFFVNRKRWWVVDAVCAALVLRLIISSVVYVNTFSENALMTIRNFYGSHRVAEHNKGTEDEFRELVHGTITHGIQFMSPQKRREPVAYYAPRSGVGIAISTLDHGPRSVGVIGLGAGAVAAYARPADVYTFYEINPQVIDIARTQFSFISDSPGTINIQQGDGRLSLERRPGMKHDLLAVDAFSGDSIPAHLLTVQALQLYLNRLKTNGILALHISNRQLNLVPVVEALGRQMGIKAVLIKSEADDRKKIFEADWVLMSAGRDLTTIPDIIGKAAILKTTTRFRPWTDDYNNLFNILK